MSSILQQREHRWLLHSRYACAKQIRQASDALCRCPSPGARPQSLRCCLRAARRGSAQLCCRAPRRMPHVAAAADRLLPRSGESERRAHVVQLRGYITGACAYACALPVGVTECIRVVARSATHLLLVCRLVVRGYRSQVTQTAHHDPLLARAPAGCSACVCARGAAASQRALGACTHVMKLAFVQRLRACKYFASPISFPSNDTKDSSFNSMSASCAMLVVCKN